jgi:hypothetical protein
MNKDIKIDGIWFSFAAAKCIEETGCSPTEDRIALETGAHTKETLLNFCLDGADPDREQGWRDYVEAVKDHSLSPPPAVQGVKVGAGWVGR